MGQANYSWYFWCYCFSPPPPAPPILNPLANSTTKLKRQEVTRFTRELLHPVDNYSSWLWISLLEAWWMACAKLVVGLQPFASVRVTQLQHSSPWRITFLMLLQIFLRDYHPLRCRKGWIYAFLAENSSLTSSNIYSRLSMFPFSSMHSFCKSFGPYTGITLSTLPWFF